MRKDQRTARINCRATPEECAALLKIAQIEERTVSDTMRKLIREEARRRGMWKTDKEAAA